MTMEYLLLARTLQSIKKVMVPKTMKKKCRIAIDPTRNTGVQGVGAVRGDINIVWGSRILVTNERYKHFSPLHSSNLLPCIL